MARSKKSKASSKTTLSPVSLISLVDKLSTISEQYRTIRSSIQFATSGDRKIKTLVITSSGPAEGKSTTAANLAVVFADSGQKTLLVDADLRKPTVSRTFGLSNTTGLSNLLSTRSRLQDEIQSIEVNNLDILTSGPKPPNPSELLGSKRMDEVLQEANAAYDFIIFDMPPVTAVTDAQILSSRADGTLMVVREGVTRKDMALKAKDLLDISNANVLGVVFNGKKKSTDTSYYYYGD